MEIRTCSGAPLRILLVDDYLLLTRDLEQMLVARGYTVVGVACDGMEALEQARRLQPDVALMDVHMPRCDGLCGLRLLREAMPQVCVVMLTADAEERVIRQAFEDGACEVVSKLCEIDYLASRLERIRACRLRHAGRCGAGLNNAQAGLFSPALLPGNQPAQPLR